MTVTIPDDAITDNAELDWDDEDEDRIYITTIREQSYSHPAILARIYLDTKESADHVGLAYQTVRALRVAGDFAEPDAMTGRSPGWTAKTLDKWKAKRLREARP